MNKSIVLSQNVLNTIKALPLDQQFSIVSAIAGEMIFGAVVDRELNAEEKKLYAVIKSTVCQDSMSYHAAMA